MRNVYCFQLNLNISKVAYCKLLALTCDYLRWVPKRYITCTYSRINLSSIKVNASQRARTHKFWPNGVASYRNLKTGHAFPLGQDHRKLFFVAFRKPQVTHLLLFLGRLISPIRRFYIHCKTYEQ